MPLRMPRRAGLLLATGQVTPYAAYDDGAFHLGLAKRYGIKTTGPQAGTSTLVVAHYAGTGIAFVNGTSKITDTANGLATFLTGDTIVVKGTQLNESTFTIATGGVAGEIVTNEALTDEAAGAIIKIYKQAALSNNVVDDLVTGKTWARYTSNGLKLGVASDGKLNWLDAATCYDLHPADAALQMIAGAAPILRIVGGAGEVDAFDVGDPIWGSGFASSVNNLAGYRVLSVDINGADLDISFDPGPNTMVSEAAGGARAIKLVGRSIWGYAAAANAALLGGYGDWRVPNLTEGAQLMNQEAATAVPDAVAFPAWPSDYVLSSTSLVSAAAAQAMQPRYSTGGSENVGKTTPKLIALVRG